MLLVGAINILGGSATVVFGIHDLQAQGVGLLNVPYGAFALALGVVIGRRSVIGLVAAAAFLMLDTLSELLAPLMGEQTSAGAATVKLVVLSVVIQALLSMWRARRAGVAWEAQEKERMRGSDALVSTSVITSSEKNSAGAPSPGRTRLGRRINAGLVVALSAVGFFLTAASLDIMVDHHGGRVLLTVAALACTGIWLGGLRLVMRWWIRHPLLIWLVAPGVFLVLLVASGITAGATGALD
jgi:hypothetical protein